MSVDQMLWHVNVSMREAVGDYKPHLKALPAPKALLRWAVIHVPWGRGARTRSDMYAKSAYDFDAQKAECLTLIDRIVARPPTGLRARPLGKLTGYHWRQLNGQHLDHHVRQFGV